MGSGGSTALWSPGRGWRVAGRDLESLHREVQALARDSHHGRAHALVGLPWIADGTGGRWRIGGRSESWHGLHAIGANAVDVLSRLSA